jgi:hypothetical protein
MTNDELINHFEARVRELEILLGSCGNHKGKIRDISRLLEINKWFSYELDQERFLERRKTRISKPVLIN